MNLRAWRALLDLCVAKYAGLIFVCGLALVGFLDSCWRLFTVWLPCHAFRPIFFGWRKWGTVFKVAGLLLVNIVSLPCWLHNSVSSWSFFSDSFLRYVLSSYCFNCCLLSAGFASNNDTRSLLRGGDTPQPFAESGSSSDLQLHTSSSSSSASGPPPAYEVGVQTT